MNRYVISITSLLFLAGCASVQGPRVDQQDQPTPMSRPAPPSSKIALALGGGAARGFAHIGVIKALEAQGIYPDIIVGTSAGAVVGALYASGHTGYELQKIAFQVDESQISDWILPNRGVIKGEGLQNFVNQAVGNRTLEQLAKPFGAVATDLRSGAPIVFRTGDTGMAVRASGSVPGVFQPVSIRGRDYVDGGLVSPIPVRAAKDMGAGFVIAVDISSLPQVASVESTLDILFQTFSIMGQSLGQYELMEADVVIRPATGQVASTDFNSRHLAVMEGERAVTLILPQLKDKLEKFREKLTAANTASQQTQPTQQ